MSLTLQQVSEVNTPSATFGDVKVNIDLISSNQQLIKDYICALEELYIADDSGGTVYNLTWDDSTNTLTLVGADGTSSQVQINDTNTTYDLSADTNQEVYILTGSDNSRDVVPIIRENLSLQTSGNNISLRRTLPDGSTQTISSLDLTRFIDVYSLAWNNDQRDLTLVRANGPNSTVNIPGGDPGASTTDDLTNVTTSFTDPPSAGLQAATNQSQANEYFDDSITDIYTRFGIFESFELNPKLYIDTNTGSDANDGQTWGTAFQTWGKAKSYLASKIVVGRTTICYRGVSDTSRMTIDTSWNTGDELIIRGEPDYTQSTLQFGATNYNDGLNITDRKVVTLINLNFEKLAGSRSTALAVTGSAIVNADGSFGFSGAGHFAAPIVAVYGAGSTLSFRGAPYRTPRNSIFVNMSDRNRAFAMATGGGTMGFRYNSVELMQDFALRNNRPENAFLVSTGSNSRIDFTGSGGEINEATINVNGGTGNIIGNAWYVADFGLVKRSVHTQKWPFLTVADATAPISTLGGNQVRGGLYADDLLNDYRRGNLTNIVDNGDGTATITQNDGTTWKFTIAP